MGSQVLAPLGAIGKTGKFLGIAAAALLVMATTAAIASAGDLSLQSADTMNITNSSSKLLPQSQAGESGWLSGLHVSGYVSQQFGMWQDPHNTHEWTHSSNALAVSRTTLQIDENYRLNENNTFFAREWFVYEPPYAFNSSNNASDASVNNAYLSPYCGALATPSSQACRTGRFTSNSPGHYTNDFYNNYQVRDAWWQNKTGPLTTFVGNQIVVWGQSLAFRVGDVINPQDFAWSFGFANLEQSRNAQWMVHPILNLPEWGPLQSNFLEVVVLPGFQPQWWEDSFTDGRNTGPGAATKDGRYATYGTHAFSMRFDVSYDTQFDPQFTIAPYTDSGLPGRGPKWASQWWSQTNFQAGVQEPSKPIGYLFCPNAPVSGPCYHTGSVTGSPLLHTYDECFNGGAFPGAAKMPYNLRAGGAGGLALGNYGIGKNCILTLSHGNLNQGAAGNYALWDFGPYQIPGMQPQNWNDGARLHTLVGATELTLLYFNDNMDSGFPTARLIKPYYTNLGKLSFTPIQEVGMTADRPIPVPASLGEYLPIVGRGEAVYVNHQSFYNANPLAFSGIRYSDVVNWMAALDIDQAYAPWLTSTGNLTAFFEVYDHMTMDNNKFTPVGALLSRQNDKNEVYALASIGTGYFWEDVEPTWTMIYQPKGDTFALFPTLVLNPPWTKKYFVKLQTIQIMGGDRGHGLGLFKGQSLDMITLQYNFNLL